MALLCSGQSHVKGYLQEFKDVLATRLMARIKITAFAIAWIGKPAVLPTSCRDLSVRYRTGWHYPEIPHADARVLPPPLRPQVAIPPRLEPLHLHLLAFACQVCLFGARSGPSFKRRLFLGEVSSTKPSRPWIAT